MIKLVHVSDTHLKDFNPEPGDILIHSGDALNSGRFSELSKFRTQLKLIKDNYKHIVYVAGNHDIVFEDDYGVADLFLKEEINNLIILHNQSIELEGIKFYGTSDQPECGWAFGKLPDELEQSYNNIPDDTEVLITHCPPRGIQDLAVNSNYPNGKRFGSIELLAALNRLPKLKAHLYGHIHYSHGILHHNNIIYSNAAICNEYYFPEFKENVIDI